MRRQYRHHLALIAVCMAACMLLSCCAAAAHTAEHACSYYDNCRLCQQLDHGRNLGLLALVLLFGCAFLHSCTQARRNHAQRCLVPVTLISQSIQMND